MNGTSAAARETAEFAVDNSRFKLHTIEDLLDLPEPKWIIDGLFTEGAFVLAYGPTNVGKSFLMADWAFSIASGTAWQGHRTAQGRVLYVAAEGGRQFGKRFAALLDEHGLKSLPMLRVIAADIQIVAELEQLKAAIEEFRPDVIIADPFSEVAADIDENSKQEVFSFIRAVRSIRSHFNCAFVLVHHTGWDASRERGSSSMRGTIDTLFSISAKGDVLTIENKKQRDHERKREPIILRLSKRAGRFGKREYQSCVLEPFSRVGARAGASTFVKPDLLVALRALGSVATPARSRDWESELQKVSPLSAQTFNRRRKGLEALGLVKQLRVGWYDLTPEGRAALGGAT